MSKKSYYVTDAGGPRPDIAGAKRQVGERISLTAAEAEFELSRGTIETQEEKDKREGRVPEETAPAKAKGGK